MAKRTCKRRRSRHRKRIATLITSPLARGTVLPRNPQSLIPACAGQTRLWSRPSHHSPSHPRLRGADFSPLPLGNQRPPLIPACAGQTTTISQAVASSPSHPRLRGADFPNPAHNRLAGLSSPLARGRPRTPCTGRSCSPLIPACAGQTQGRPCLLYLPNSHPRLRGADPGEAMPSISAKLSSPLARGRLSHSSP